jgi:hypothetical protein
MILLGVISGIFGILILFDIIYYSKNDIGFISEQLLKRKVQNILLNNTTNGMSLVKWKRKNTEVITIVYKLPKVNKITIKKTVVDRVFPDLIGKFKKVSDFQKNLKNYTSPKK